MVYYKNKSGNYQNNELRTRNCAQSRNQRHNRDNYFPRRYDERRNRHKFNNDDNTNAHHITKEIIIGLCKTAIKVM